MRLSTKSIDRTRILLRCEIVDVLTELARKGRRAVNSRQNRVIFRLATCAGLRVSEVVGLSMSNVVCGSKRPHIAVPSAIAKRHKARKVPLWWDGATLADIDAWRRERLDQGAKPGDPFVCVQSKNKQGKRLSVRNAQARFKAAIKVLGKERVNGISIHAGRHSFCSHALAGGRSLAEVRDACGHASISTTSIYLHVPPDDDDEPGNLFDFAARTVRSASRPAGDDRPLPTIDGGVQIGSVSVAE